MNLGDPEEQQLELQEKLDLVTVKVRFFPPMTAFIQEGELRHLKQKIILGSFDQTTGKPNYVDYKVPLPPRSLKEFSIWVYRYMDKAQVLSPPQLVEKHRQAFQLLFNLYVITVLTQRKMDFS